MTKHTEGPWVVGGNWMEVVAFKPFQKSEGRRQVSIAITGSFVGVDEQIANTRLIASAPDLLAAAKEVCRADGSWGDLAGAIRNLQAAIIAAEGDTPDFHGGNEYEDHRSNFYADMSREDESGD